MERVDSISVPLEVEELVGVGSPEILFVLLSRGDVYTEEETQTR